MIKPPTAHPARAAVAVLMFAVLAAGFAVRGHAETGYARRVLCGNSYAYTDQFGYVWSADQTYASSPGPYPWGTISVCNDAQFPYLWMENTLEWPLFQSERWANGGIAPAYRFDVPGPGTYFVKVLFSENYFGVGNTSIANAGIGARVFHLDINGVRLLDHFDILAASGGRAARAVVRTFPVVVGSTPPYRIEITTQSVVENAKINAIEVADHPTQTDAIDDYGGAAPAGEEALRINCGGTQSRDADGTLWMADEAFAKLRRWGFVQGEERSATQTAWATPAAYRLATWREGGAGFQYRVHVPNGRYAVKLVFAENQHQAAGLRVFDVSVNGAAFAANLDAFAEAGFGGAVERTGSVSVNDEQVTIAFPRITAGLAMLSAVELRVESVSNDAFVDFVERRTLDFFLSGSSEFVTVNPANGLVTDRKTQFYDFPTTSPCSMAGLGFGLTALCIGEARGWLTPAAAQQQLTTTLTFLRNAPAWTDGSETGLIQQHGFYYHMVKMATGLRDGNSELSSIDSTLLYAGVFTAMLSHPGTPIATLAKGILDRVDWTWMVNGDPNGFPAMEWKPPAEVPGGFGPAKWDGYSEGALLNFLGLASTTHPLSTRSWYNLSRTWWGTNGVTYLGFYPPYAPLGLFVHMYPQCYVDLRGRPDAKCDYFLNNTLAATDNRNFCLANAAGYTTYANGGWGLSACDSPRGGYSYVAYRPWTGGHDGTVTPQMVGAAVPFAPNHALPALRQQYFQYKHFLWGRFGFADAYNLNAPRTLDDDFPGGAGWVAAGVIGLDSGSMIASLENYRTGYLWDLFSGAPAVQAALKNAGFGDPLVDDFENDHSEADAADARDARWWVSNPALFSLATVASANGNSSTSLRVTYDKPVGSDWDFLAVSDLDQPANLSYWLGRGELDFKVSGRIDLMLKFRDIYNRESGESPVFSVNRPGGWQDCAWNLAGLNWKTCDPRQVRDILIFPQPGGRGSGTFYLDDLSAGPLAGAATPTPAPTVAAPAGAEVRFRVAEAGVLAYPNPAKDQVTFAFLASGSTRAAVDIYNVHGERAARVSGTGDGPEGTLSQAVWDCRGLAPGVYYYHWTVQDASGRPARSGVRKLALR